MAGPCISSLQAQVQTDELSESMSVAGSTSLTGKDEARVSTGGAGLSVLLVEALGKDQERVSVGGGRVIMVSSFTTVALMVVSEVLLAKSSSSERATNTSTVILVGCVIHTVRPSRSRYIW